MGDRKQINITVPEERRDKWNRAAEENPEYQSLAHLIRLSVMRELSGENEKAADVDLSEFEERFDGVEARLDELSSDVRSLIAEREEEGIEDLTNEVYDAIPRIEDEEVWEERLERGDTQIVTHDAVDAPDSAVETYDVAETEDGYEASEGGTAAEIIAGDYVTVDDLTAQFEVSEYRLRLAIQRVRESFTRVKTREFEGETYVYEVI